MASDRPQGAETPDGSIVGYFGLTTDWRLEGWCWSPLAPRIRQMVEITLNGFVVHRCLATQFNDTLLHAGMGDGRCGFSLSPPAQIGTAASGEAIVEARAARSGTVIGRVVFHPEQALVERNARLDQIVARTADAFTRVRPAPDGSRRRIGDALIGFGQALRGRPFGRDFARIPPRGQAGANAGAALRNADALLSRCAPVTIDTTSTSTVSLVVAAQGGWHSTLTAFRHAAKVLSNLVTEFVVIDGGSDAMTAMLPTKVEGLRLVRDSGPGLTARACNEALVATRGMFVCLVDDPGRFSAMSIKDHLGPDAGVAMRAWASPEIERLTQSGNIVNSAGNATYNGIALIIRRTDFLAAGGLDASDSGTVAWIDFAWKLAALDIPITLWPQAMDASSVITRDSGYDMAHSAYVAAS